MKKIIVISSVSFAIGLLIGASLNSNKNIAVKSVLKKDMVASVYTPEQLVDAGEITHGDINKKDVIFTFDGGSTTQSSDTILNTLSKHGVKASFFLTGRFVESNPDLVKRIITNGHEIYNHTYDHKDLTTLSNKQIIEELNEMNSVLETVAGISTKPFFRAPYGKRNRDTLSVAAGNGYRSVYWSVDALDWKGVGIETQEQIKDRILSKLAPGNIYLMHIGDPMTGEVLDNVLTEIENRGYKIVSLKEGL